MKKMLLTLALCACSSPAFAQPGSHLIGKLTVGMTCDEVKAVYPDATGSGVPNIIAPEGHPLGAALHYDDNKRLDEAKLDGIYGGGSLEAALTAEYGEPKHDTTVVTWPSRQNAILLSWAKDGVSITMDKRPTGVYFLTYKAVSTEGLEGL